MSFYVTVFCNNSTFINCRTHNSFCLHREMHGENWLKLSIVDSENEKGAIATLSVTYKTHKSNKQHYFNEQSYFLDFLFVDEEYQKEYLGSLLIYIISTEIRVNLGRFLYIYAPYQTAIPFYLALGFFPAPEIVLDKEDYFEVDSLITVVARSNKLFNLNNTIVRARSSSLWRGNLQVINTMLANKVHDIFVF